MGHLSTLSGAKTLMVNQYPAPTSLSPLPNPFNPTTHFGFRIADFGLVTLKVYNVLGQEVATLVDDLKEPGTYTVQWNASGVASGVYYYKLTAGSYHDVKKMIVIK